MLLQKVGLADPWGPLHLKHCDAQLLHWSLSPGLCLLGPQAAIPARLFQALPPSLRLPRQCLEAATSSPVPQGGAPASLPSPRGAISLQGVVGAGGSSASQGTYRSPGGKPRMPARPDGCLLAAGQSEPDAVWPLYIEMMGSGEGPQIPPPQQNLRSSDMKTCARGVRRGRGLKRWVCRQSSPPAEAFSPSPFLP